ncbi:nucleoside triphosphate pyrophosphohydrolase, partial [Eubacteriales bacterium OttesenSCG-928-A19]|nr:nucleoside triphosphate pyrophosphohydrolase [Eubacteriales bacterium OttesenSCG-928-A19]
MPEIIYNKLVRNKIPDIIRKNGKEPVTRVLEGEAFLAALDAKLREEVEEYLENPCMEEVADILEVLEAIVAMRRMPQAELRRVKNAKALK